MEVINRDGSRDRYFEVEDHNTCDGGMYFRCKKNGIEKHYCIPYEDIRTWHYLEQ